MNLDELKAKNEADAKEETDADELQEEETIDEEEAVEDAEESEGEEESKEKVVEAWQETDDQTSESVPVGAHVKLKQKLKGRISERDDKIAELEAKIEAMGKPQLNQEMPKRPKEDDFKSDEEYEVAVDKYEEDLAAARYDKIELQRQITEAQRQAQKALKDSVEGHYERAGKLITDSGISPDVYKNTDATVRQAIEAIRPGQGDLAVDMLIDMLGDGSEKVLYFLGRNKSALGEVTTLFVSDPTGLKVATYLGQQKERLNNPKPKTSRTPKPASQANGDTPSNTKGTAAKRKYDEAHTKGKIQIAYNLKKEARASGVDVSSW